MPSDGVWTMNVLCITSALRGRVTGWCPSRLSSEWERGASCVCACVHVRGVRSQTDQERCQHRGSAETRIRHSHHPPAQRHTRTAHGPLLVRAAARTSARAAGSS